MSFPGLWFPIGIVVLFVLIFTFRDERGVRLATWYWKMRDRRSRKP